MKFFIFYKIGEHSFAAHNKSIKALFKLAENDIHVVNNSVSMLDNIMFHLHHYMFMQSKHIHISDYLDDHKYGNENKLIHPGFRNLAKISMWNDILEFVSNKTHARNDSNLSTNVKYIKMVRELSMILSIDVNKYLDNPLIDPLAPEWIVVTEAICKYIGTQFCINLKDILLMSRYDYNLMDKTIPSKALAERIKEITETTKGEVK